MGVLKYLGKDNAYHSLPIGSDSSTVANYHYSEDEEVIGCWVDGRPIYRRLIPTLNVSITNNNAYVLISTSGLNIKQMVDMYGIAENSRHVWLEMPYCHMSGLQYCLSYQYSVEENCLYFICGSGYTIQNIYTIIEYTKTTDAENSFDVSMLTTGDLDTTATDEEVEAIFS